MKSNATLSLLFLLFFATPNLFSQKYELGKVTVEELSQKAYPQDSTAGAAILFKRGDVNVQLQPDYTLMVYYTVEMKIKIYKNKGFSYANFEKFYNAKSDELNFSDVATYNLVDGKVEKTSLKKDGMFTNNENKYVQSKKLSFPNVKEGSIIEYKYTLKSPRYFQLEDFYFQYDIPANYVIYKVSNPDKVYYNRKTYGFLDLQVTGGQSSLDSGGQSVYSIKNVPAMKEEGYVNNINNYRSKVGFELASIYYESGIKTFSTDWSKLIGNIAHDENFGEQLKMENYFKDDIKPIISGLTTRDEKIAAIFNYVKTRMRWNEYNGYFCDQSVKKAYQEKTGNVAEINLMLTAMLRHAEIDANPILLSTRSNGISFFPSMNAYNYVIVGVEDNDNMILLDATNKNAYVNVVPTRALNWTGRVVKKEGTFLEVNLMPKTISKDVVNVIASISNEGEVSGKIREQYYDYNGYVFRSQHADLTNEAHMERIEKKFKGIEIDEYDLSNKQDFDKPAIENYSFKSTNSIEIIGDKMYFSPMLFLALDENPFKQDERAYPIDFSYPYEDKYLITLTIPDGYAVESLPQSVSIPMSNDNGSLKYMIVNKEKQIQLSVVMDINHAVIAPDSYPELKGFFSEVIKKQTEKIVLKKI